MLKPSGYSVSNFRIQKFSLLISCWMRVSLALVVFLNWSIMVNFACLLKLWLSCWKCLQAVIVSTFSKSFRWLFSLMLTLVSAFPTNYLLNKTHSIKYITQLLVQLTLWNILYIFLVWWLLKVEKRYLMPSTGLLMETKIDEHFCKYLFSKNSKNLKNISTLMR